MKTDATETSIATVGKAIVFQSILKWVSIVGMLWLFLSYADGWVTAAFSAT